MDEQVIDDLYNRAVSQGYKKSRQEFIGLLHSDSEVMNDMYSYVQSKGYKKGVDDFKNLVGATTQSPSIEQPTTQIPFVKEVKKKDDTTELPLEVGSSVSPESAEATPEMAQFGYQPGKPLPEQIPSVQPDQPAQTPYTQEVMFGPMGISGVKTTGRAPEFQGKSIPKVIGEIGKVLAKGVVKSPASVLETVAIASAAARNLAAKTGIVDETSALDISVPIGAANVNFYQAAGEWKDLVNDFVPTDKDIESGFWGQTANALGEMIPVLLTGLISGGAKAIAKEAGKKGLSMQAVSNYGKNVVSRIGTPQGVLTISQVAAPSYEQAKLEGATENEALGYAIQNAVMTFPLEMLPVNNLFKRLDNVLVGNTGVEVLKRAVVGGGEEAITEGIQAVYENVTADAIYGTTRSFLDGVGESAAVGGTVGAIMNGVLTALLGRRARATSDKEIEEIDKSIKDVEQKIAQVDSNNESLKETVKVLEESKPRKLSYGSAEYNFLESKNGDLEYADDALTEEQAQGIIGNLTNSYKKIDFQIQEVEPDDPYQPTTYKIIGKPKTIQQDAIQEQAAGEVPVQSGATVSQEVEQGVPQAEPQVVAEAGAQEEIKTNDEKFFEEMDVVFPNDYIGGGYAATDAEGNLLGRISMSSVDDNTVKIDEVVSEKRGQRTGNGSAIMRIVTENADKNNTTLTLTPNLIGGMKVKGFDTPQKLMAFYEKFGFVKDNQKATMTRLPKQAEVVSSETQPAVSPTVSPAPAKKGKAKAVVAPVPAPVVEAVSPAVSPEPIVIADVQKDMKVSFAPETAIEVQKATREDTRGRKFTYDAAVTAQVTDKNGTPIGSMTKRANEDGILSFTIKNTKGQNINKGKAYPTERDARTALAEQVNRVQAKATPAPTTPVVEVAKERKAAKQAAKETAAEAERIINSEEATPEFLEKAYSVFDNLEKQVGNTLKRNANDALLGIPLTTLQAALKAVKVLIKGGIAVRDAIRRVAAENKINENKLREAFVALTNPTESIEDTYEKYHVAPQEGHTKIDVTGSEPIKKGETFGTVTYSNKEEGDVVVDSFSINDIDKLSNRSSGFITTARNIAQGFISIKPSPKEITEQLFGKGKSYKSLSDANKTKVDKERIKQTTQFKLPWSDNKALASLNAYINKNKDSKPSDYYDVVKKKSKDIINSFKEEVKNNLRALYNNVSEEFREVSRQWYNGANRLAQGISESYGISLEQSAGILAALSPKNNWFNNISAAERVIRAWADHQDTTVTQEMVDRTIAYMERSGEAPFAKDIRAVFSDTKGAPISELVEEYKKTNDAKILTQIGITMRIIDQSEYSPIVYSVSPEGFIDGKYGVIGWSGGAALTNAVSMLIDPSIKNISSRLGNGNKVRNFYGNIIDPENAEFLTADTHAFAAGLMLPASANEAQDFGLFDGGMSVEYAIFKDAYTEVAKEFGILPRELQSITWEAVRGSINTDNRTPSMVKEINRISEELLTNGESNENRTNEILKKYPIKFSKGEWSNKRGIEAQKGILGGNEGVSQTADTGGSTTISGDLRGTDTQVGGESAGIISFDQVADLDVKSKDNLAVVADFLDSIDKSIAKRLKTNANDALLAIPLTVVQGMVKGMKALVQGGMTVRDALKKIAADNNISQDKLKDLFNLIPITQEFNALMTKADNLIARQKSKGVEEKRIVSNLDTMVRKFYQDMDVTDAQRKIMEREARARMGVEPRKAASIGRVLGVLKDIANVTRQEKLKIISRIRELGRDVGKDLAKEIREMGSRGVLSPSQVASIVSRALNLNPLNERSASNFVDYMAKVFSDANYAAELTDAVSSRKRLKSLSKNKDKAANLRALASKFAEIDPTMVEDIYEYNRIAKMIEESVKGSSVKGKDVKFANIVQEGDVIPYINKTLDAQKKTLFEEKLKEVQDILSEIKDVLGVDAKDLSYEDLLAILSETDKKSKGKDNDKLVRDAINKAFDIYSSVIKSIIKTGVDPFSGQEVKYTDAQKKIISDFMDMDLNIIPTPQALEAVDAALNFLQNKSTAKMESIFKGYMGEKNARELVKKGVKASALRKYFSPGLARFFGEQTTNLGLLFERLFKGFEAGGMVQDMMGLTDLINGKSQAQNESNGIINDYVKEFYTKKANGEAFNTESNNVERGMAAFLMRNVIGTAAEIKAEFKRRKDLIKESIEELGNGNEKEVAKSLVYQEVYDKILKDANSIDDVTSKVDAVNLDAVKFWQDQWQSKYDELSDVSLNVYNKILDKDVNYTPDRYARLSANTETVEITENDMAFNVNNGTLYNKEAGVLMEATRPDALPVDRFIDLSFDSNNANSMYDALVDIKTAGPIRQVQAFLNSKSFKKIFPKAEDAVILKGSKKDKRIGRIELFTRNFRNKNPYSEDEFSAAVRNLNRLANVGVSQALGGIFQPVKQVIPAAMNTLINGGSLDFNAMTNPDKIKFMMDSGYAIGFRGVESQAQVESLNKLMDMAAKSRGEKAMKYIEEANKTWLKIFLVKPDVFIARASWMTYYEQSLEKQGLDSKGIDYKTHKLNEKAANYAQRMLDRQQNVSDADLSGKLFSEKNPSKQVMMKVFMPFASFRMNQSARLGADIATVTSKVSTEEDRKIAARSLAGFAVEMATFRALSLGISLLTTSLVASMMGSDEEDEEKKKNSIIKGQATNTVSDILSPIPFTDPIIQALAATTLQSAQDVAGVDEEDMVSLYSPQDKGYLEQIGLFGFAAQRVAQTVELVWMSSVGSYRDSYGKKKYVSDDDKEALRLLIGPAILTNVGLAPSEMNSVVRASMSAAKKNSSTKEGGSTSGKDYESQMLDIMEEDLLEGYENKSEMKRYNPRLYEQNFGEGSEYYELTKEKRAEEKKAADEKQKEKDAEYGYKGDSKGFGSRSKNSGKGFGAKKFGED
jgi:hypothetical protein